MRRRGLRAGIVLGCLVGAFACTGEHEARPTLRISASALGAEGDVLRTQLARFREQHPDVDVVLHPTPDAADLRHQLYVQWLNAGAVEPDVLQLDVIWTPEFAAAGWVLPLDRFGPELADFFPRTIEANRWRGSLFALPWFADVGLLYYRTDLVSEPPATFDALIDAAQRAQREQGLPVGMVWQGARYEGLVTTYLEFLGGAGGRMLDADGTVVVDTPAAEAALGAMQRQLASGVAPVDVLAYHEEEARLAFQNGRAAFMRNWPYAYALVDDPTQSKVAGRVGIAPMPASPGGRPTAALGGSQLAINARTRHPALAYALVAFLTDAAQMRERAEVVGQYPTRRSLYDDPQLSTFLRAPADRVRAIVEAAAPRPVTPVYTELSERLQIELHRALTGQKDGATALHDAAAGMRLVLARAHLDDAGSGGRGPQSSASAGVVAALLVFLAMIVGALLRRRRGTERRRGLEADTARLAWAFVMPALGCIAVIAVFPLAWTLWESVHHHDLRLPWTGRPFAGLANYAEAFADPRWRAALGHTAIFTAGSVTIELVAGLVLALGLNRAYRGQGVVRAAVLVPWAIPTVVAALVWSFMFQPVGIANETLRAIGAIDQPFAWFASAVAAWVPVILADVWKTTPFVALLLLAGLQSIDDAVLEAARVDGASAWQQLWRVTLPLLAPTMAVAVLFRTLDALRVFDLIYVMTGGGPGTSTEPIALYTFNALLQNLRFGYASALSMLIFVLAFGLAMVFIRLTGASLVRERAE